MSGSSSWEDAVAWLRAQPDAEALVRDAYYDDPLPQTAARYHASAEWAAIRPLLPPAPAVALDVGAGRGIASYALAQDGYTVTALEPDPSPLVGADAIRALAQNSNIKITVIEDFSERLPFADQKFDLVFARAVLHHTRNLAGAAREFHRVLRPGGRLLAIREHVISREADRSAFLSAHPLHHRYGGENAFQLRTYIDALASAGFRLRKIIAPLASPINYAPRNKQALKRDIASRFGAAGFALRALFDVPGIWPLAQRALTATDHRPGRLYSFVCDR